MQRMLNPMRLRVVRMALVLAIGAIPALIALPASADHHLPTDTLRITLENRSNQILSPPVIVSAPHEWRPFMLGEAASSDVEALAESGNGQPLVDRALADGAYSAMVSDAPLVPGEKRSYEFESPVFEVDLWALTMAVQTNDGFFVVHSVGAPGVLSSRVQQAFFLDAGTEVNDELCANVPGPPCGGDGSVDEGGVVGPHPGLNFDADISSDYSIGSGLWATWQRASIPENPGPIPQKADYELYVSNMTADQPFSPLVIGVHPNPLDFLPDGEMSTPGWTAMAENGDNSILAQEWLDAGVYMVGTLSAPLLPGEVAKFEFSGPKNGVLFWCGMLVNTNDGFTCGMTHLPKKLQTTGGLSGVYDNGTEANTNDPADVPGMGGTGHVDEDNVIRHHPDFDGYAGTFWSYRDIDGPDEVPVEEEAS
jgi:hypothetical protein